MRDFQQRLRVERLLQALLALAQVAGGVLALRKFRGGFGCDDDLACQHQCLGVADDPVVLRLDSRRQIQHVLRHFQCHPLGGRPSDLLARRKREHAEEVLHDIQVDLGAGILEQRAGA